MRPHQPATAAGAYIPVACAFHERLEFAVLRRLRLDLGWVGEGGEACRETVLPTDVRTRAGAEWLSLRREDGRTETVRLDRITYLAELPAHPVR